MVTLMLHGLYAPVLLFPCKTDWSTEVLADMSMSPTLPLLKHSLLSVVHGHGASTPSFVDAAALQASVKNAKNPHDAYEQKEPERNL